MNIQKDKQMWPLQKLSDIGMNYHKNASDNIKSTDM